MKTIVLLLVSAATFALASCGLDFSGPQQQNGADGVHGTMNAASTGRPSGM